MQINWSKEIIWINKHLSGKRGAHPIKNLNSKLAVFPFLSCCPIIHKRNKQFLKNKLKNSNISKIYPYILTQIMM